MHILVYVYVIMEQARLRHEEVIGTAHTCIHKCTYAYA